MSKKRQQYGPEFRATVAVAAIKDDQTTSELAARFQIHPTMISTWKREMLEGAADRFEGKGGKAAKSHQDEVDSLYREIGQLAVESPLAKSSSRRKA